MLVRLVRAVRSAFHRKIVKGRVHCIISEYKVNYHDTLVTYDFAFGAMVFLEHLHVWVIWEAIFADRWEIGALPS